MSGQLSQDDVRRLLTDPSDSSRAALVPKVARQLEVQGLSGEARTLALDIVRVLSRDTSDNVRAALADNLKTSPHVPHDVARKLARDIDSVALPMLEFSTVLTESDLLEIVGCAAEAKLLAVARRPDLHDNLAHALLDRGPERVAGAVTSNAAADLGDGVLHRIIDTHGASEDVQTKLIDRPILSITIAERLVTCLSDHLKDYLVVRHALPANVATDLVMGARERATLGLLPTGLSDDRALERLVVHLCQWGRLSPSLLLRSLCLGDIAFFEAGVAALADVPVENARVLVHDRGSLGLRSILEKAGLPERLLPAFRMAIGMIRETDMRAADYDRASYSRTIMERILTQATDLGHDETDYLLVRLMDLAPASAMCPPAAEAVG